VKIRDYRGLLAVFVAGAIGISLLCSVSGMAIEDLRQSTTALALQPADIVNAAVSNLNTAGALTMQAFAELIPTSTPTLRPTHTVTSFPTTVAPLPTAFRFPTSSEPTRTRRPRPTRIPTGTAVPPTLTPVPTATDAPTATLVDTVTPIDTETLIPTPIDTDTPIPTETTPAP
jgi:hypothetical protein